MRLNLLMEHTIGGTKVLINSMGANKTKKAVLRSTSAVHGEQEIAFSYDQAACVTENSICHTRKSSVVDKQLMMEDLRKILPFTLVPGRCHASFPHIPSSPTKLIDWPKFHEDCANTRGK